MNVTGTLNGAPVSAGSLEIVSRLWQTELRAEAVRFDAQVGDELALSLDGAPAVTAAVRFVGQRVGHHYMVAEPLVTQRLRMHVDHAVGPLVMDGMRPSTIANMLLGMMVSVHPGLDAPLPRWTTRERHVAWAWRSLLRTVAARTGLPVAWRHDARNDVVVVEAHRGDWPEREARLLQRNADWLLAEAAPLQAGDVVDGRAVVYVRTQLDEQTHRTRIRTVAL